jgi:hypothetical protein
MKTPEQVAEEIWQFICANIHRPFMFHEKDMWKCKHKIAAIIERERRAAVKPYRDTIKKMHHLKEFKEAMEEGYIEDTNIIYPKGHGTEPEE